MLDKLTYAGRRENVEDVDRTLRARRHRGRRGSRGRSRACDAIVNFAAETHVDRSIVDPAEFIKTDVIGTSVLLEAARERSVRYVQVSTDEVYGSIEEGSFTEESRSQPSARTRATKAGGDLLVGAYYAHLRHGDADLPRLQQLRARTSTPRS